MAEPPSVRIHRIPFSTNVERVALAAGFKGISVEWVDHDAADRSDLIELSGQELVPVAEIEGEIIVDSMAIVARLESLAPQPTLYPAGGADGAWLAIFVDWFNLIWKLAPNAIAAERLRASPNQARIAELREYAHATVVLFEGLLGETRFLLGDSLGAADVCAFPFLKYAAIDPDPADRDEFHPILAECLRPAEAPRLVDWIERIDATSRA